MSGQQAAPNKLCKVVTRIDRTTVRYKRNGEKDDNKTTITTLFRKVHFISIDAHTTRDDFNRFIDTCETFDEVRDAKGRLKTFCTLAQWHYVNESEAK